MHVTQSNINPLSDNVPPNSGDFLEALGKASPAASLDAILAIADPIHTGLLVFDLQGRLFYQTRKTQSLRLAGGRPKADLRVTDFFPAGGVDVDSRFWRRVISGDVVKFRHALEEPIQATILHLEVLFQKVALISGVYVLCYLKDITSHQLQESELAEFREQLDLVESVMGVGFAKWDLFQAEVSLTPRQAEIWGVDLESFRGRFEDVLQNIHPDDQQQLIEGLRREAPIRYRVFDANRQIRQLLSRQRIVDDAGHPAILQVTVDVTAIQEASEFPKRIA